MKSYNERLMEGRDLLDNSENSGPKLYEELYLAGVSLRIISELTGVSKSKLQRYLAENGIKRRNLNTEKRDMNVAVTKRMLDDGACVDDIAESLDVNKRTVLCYMRELGIESTDFFWG